MDMTFVLSSFMFVAALTVLTVEAVKKLLDSSKKTYNSTILAAVVSVVLSIGCSICYIIYHSIAINAQVCVEVVFLVFLSFLGSTVGYDKVVKEIFRKNDK